MDDVHSHIKRMLGIKGQKTAPHTVLSDLNEITCFATLCDPPSVNNDCIKPLSAARMVVVPAVTTGFAQVRAALGKYLTSADEVAFNLLKTRLNTVGVGESKGKLAGGIKIIQGYNEAIFLVDQLEKKAIISESYFTNTKTLLQSALRVAGAGDVATSLDTPGWRPNPADILIKTTPLSGGEDRVLGVSLKASYGRCAPTICNFGMHGHAWDIASFGPLVLAAHQKRTAVGQSDKTKLLIQASQQVVRGIEKTYAAAGGARGFLEAMLHCQPNNLPYLFVAAQGNTCYGIDFDKFKRALGDASDITVKAKIDHSKIGQSLVFTISSGGDQMALEFSFRVKRTANSATDPSLKINVTMTPKTKTFLCDHFPISGVEGQCSMKGGGKN